MINGTWKEAKNARRVRQECDYITRTLRFIAGSSPASFPAAATENGRESKENLIDEKNSN